MKKTADKAEALQSVLATALGNRRAITAFDVFGSDLPGKVFEGVYDQPRPRNWREIDL